MEERKERIKHYKKTKEKIITQKKKTFQRGWNKKQEIRMAVQKEER